MFTEGQRVMVARFDSPYDCDLSGFYGHVVSQTDGMVFVELIGCISAAPDRETADSVLSSSPWPFYHRELEPAD